MMELLSTSGSFPKQGLPIGKDPFQEDWTIAVFVFALILLAWARSAYPFHLSLVLDSFRAGRFIKQRVRDEEALAHPASWILLGVSVCSGALLIYHHHLYYGFDLLGDPGFGSFGICAAAVLVGVLLKMLSLSGLRHLLGVDTGIREYKYHFLLLIEGMGLFFLPLTLLIAFMESFSPELGFRIAHPLAAIALLLLLYRAVSIAWSNGVPPFYIFLYLCTLEILPLIALSKAFIDHY
jgi:hypothetical protein